MIPLQVLFFLGYILPRDLIEKESETDSSIFCVVCSSLLSLEPLQARIGDSNFISHHEHPFVTTFETTTNLQIKVGIDTETKTIEKKVKT